MLKKVGIAVLWVGTVALITGLICSSGLKTKSYEPKLPKTNQINQTMMITHLW